MKKIRLDRECEEEISINDIDDGYNVFVKRDGKMAGMFIEDQKGWILRIGGMSGSCGHSRTLKEAIREASKFDYTFHAEFRHV